MQEVNEILKTLQKYKFSLLSKAESKLYSNLNGL